MIGRTWNYVRELDTKRRHDSRLRGCEDPTFVQLTIALEILIPAQTAGASAAGLLK